MKKLFLSSAVAFGLVVCVASATDPMVGGAAMSPTNDIIDNASQSKDHTTLVTAVKAADLVTTLKGPGPFTVFAPTNAAFSALPDGTVDTLLRPANKTQLSGLLKYHVVPRKIDSKALLAAIKEGDGNAELPTVAGGKLMASMSGDSVIVTDEMGGKATVTIADVQQSNGMIHVVDKVLMPE